MSITSNTPLIQTEIIDGILRITLNRLDKKNAMNEEMYVGLRDAFLEANKRSDINVIFLSGDEYCFTAGNDLKDFLAVSQEIPDSAGSNFIRTLAQTKVPIVAAVGGPAVGIGTTILLHCDLVYAGEKAGFRLPFVELGLCPEAGSSYLLPRLAGYQTAAELLLLGEFFSASKAKEIGLVNQVFPEENLMAQAWQKAEKLSSLPQGALRLTKQLLKKGFAHILRETIEDELNHFSKQLLTPEAKSAFKKFFEG